ncbi:MAG: hypothetical protein M3Q48_04065 [Actinomycetota bacterium]|nr:hypothetical protein [Actinomycetota bacterium]
MSPSSSRYSLAGVQAATTARHQAFIARASEVLEADDRVLAAYLVGGFAVGAGDAFSDVDLQVLVAEESTAELAEGWVDLIHCITPTVNIHSFASLNPAGPSQPATGGGVCITPDWLHFDVVFRVAGSVDGHAIEGMVPLFDKAGLLPSGPRPRPDRRREPFFPEGAALWFLYMLGNVVAAIGRDEPVPATNGVILMRDIGLVRLFLAEQGLESTREGAGLFPFTKRLRRYLTDEQNRILESLPPLEATIDSAIDGYVALAETFLPRAQRLAASTGADWPADYARATVAYFERAVGVKLRV